MFMGEEQRVWTDHPSFYESVPTWVFAIISIAVFEYFFPILFPFLNGLGRHVTNEFVASLLYSEKAMRTIVAVFFLVHPIWKMLVIHTTNYSITNQRLIIGKGIFHRRYEEVELFRVRDISIRRSLIMRLFGLGTVIVYSRDMTSPDTRLRSISRPFVVADTLRKHVFAAKEARGLREMEVT